MKLIEVGLPAGASDRFIWRDRLGLIERSVTPNASYVDPICRQSYGPLDHLSTWLFHRLW